MAYGRRPRLGRLDLSILGASPEKLAARREEIPAVDVPVLTDDQQHELYRLNYRAKVSILAPPEELLRRRLMLIARGGK